MSEPERRLGPVARLRLDAAAQLLQAPVQGAGGWGMVIQVRSGESWYQAVLRTVDGLPEADRARLKGLVDWVQDYELSDGGVPRPDVRKPAAAVAVKPEAAAPAVTEVLHAVAQVDFDYEVEPDEDAIEMALMSVEGVYTRPRA